MIEEIERLRGIIERPHSSHFGDATYLIGDSARQKNSELGKLFDELNNLKKDQVFRSFLAPKKVAPQAVQLVSQPIAPVVDDSNCAGQVEPQTDPAQPSSYNYAMQASSPEIFFTTQLAGAASQPVVPITEITAPSEKIKSKPEKIKNIVVTSKKENKPANSSNRFALLSGLDSKRKEKQALRGNSGLTGIHFVPRKSV
jgi:hypothetical protein